MPLIVCNWKNYIDTDINAVSLITSYDTNLKTKVIVCPSSIHLPQVIKASENGKKDIEFAAQDIAVSNDKPQTGRISGSQLKILGVKYVIVGHSETRAAGVTNESIASKAMSALDKGITPIICLSEHKINETFQGEEVLNQLIEMIDILGDEVISKSLIAYEPTAYIGGDESLPPDEIKKIISILREKLDEHNIRGVKILYGGSVNENNAFNLVREVGVDGLLIGRVGVQKEKINMLIKSFV